MLIIDAPARASEGTRKIAERASLVVQPTNPALDDLGPAVRLFHELVRAGVPTARLAFALNYVLTEAEEAAARHYLSEAGYEVLAGFLPARPVTATPRVIMVWLGHRNPLRRYERQGGCVDPISDRQDHLTMADLSKFMKRLCTRRLQSPPPPIICKRQKPRQPRLSCPLLTTGLSVSAKMAAPPAAPAAPCNSPPVSAPTLTAASGPWPSATACYLPNCLRKAWKPMRNKGSN